MPSLKTLALAATAALCLATTARAQDAAQDNSRWFVHVGPAVVMLDTKVKMTAGGQPAPGAAVSVPDQWTAEAELGYFVTPNVALAWAGGYPPVATVNASGSISELGRAGQMTYGPSTVNLQYHFNRGGIVQPYIGGGLTVMLVFDTKDAAMSRLKVDDSVGGDVQVGSDFMISKHWGAYVDYKKAFLSTTARGMLGPAPVLAKVQLNPGVASAGVVYRF